jgi:glycosyltransferase involved in cell wall biosynthesis
MNSKQPLVSIIIPTYNRAHLIGETLDSVLMQTYTNWECIIIDDGSTDNTDKVVQKYLAKDSRFLYYHRPKNRIKGGNACRNYGFELSKGEIVKWFDSDDLMLDIHLEKVLNELLTRSVDFVISDSENFENGKNISRKPFKFDKSKFEINALNFAQQKIGWITDDFTVRKQKVLSIQFNEKLKGGQEYNFFVKFLLQNQNGFYIDEVLTLARIHPESLTKGYHKTELQKNRVVTELKLLTLIDIYTYNYTYLNKWLYSGYVQYVYDFVLKRHKPPYFILGILYGFKVMGFIKGSSLILGLFFVYFFKRGYNLIKYSRSF